MKARKVLLAVLLASILPIPSRVVAESPAIVTPNEGTGSASAAVQKDLLAAVDRWKQAVIAKDRAGLEKVFHEDLSYGHTTGEVLNKQQSIERILASPNAYTAIDVSDVTIRVYGKIALITAKTAFHISKDGTATVANLSGLDVWIRGAQGWQLLARQLTRPAQ